MTMTTTTEDNNNNNNDMKISISDSFDGGNIEYIGTRMNQFDKSITDILVRVKPDVYTELEQIAHKQYFCFRVTISNINNKPFKANYILENAESVSYPEAWSGTTVCYTDEYENIDNWKRKIDTYYTQGQLTWEHIHTKSGSIFFSFFPPYTYTRHISFLGKCSRSPHVTNILSLGKTKQGRDIDCIQIGNIDDKTNTNKRMICWIIHRQHPGETMAEHYAEGLLIRLLGLNNNENNYTIDEQVQRIFNMYTFFIVPCMCPDGAVLGHLRTNSCGANLNREWCTKGDYIAPTIERSPEVYYVLQKMDETGCDMFLDIHGDEELPYNFLSGAEYIPKWGPRLQSLHGAFVAAYCRSTSDMQGKIGYPPMDSSDMVLQYMNVATNQISNRFDCLGLTLEMPFKDCLSNSNPEYGWTPERSRQLGQAVLDPLEYIYPHLRNDTSWENLPPEDTYITPTDDYENIDQSERGEEFQMLHKRFYSDVHEFRKKQT